MGEVPSGGVPFAELPVAEPSMGRVRWVAHAPYAPPLSSRRQVRAPYPGPPRYVAIPRWGLPPTTWVPAEIPGPRPIPIPKGELPLLILFARATGVLCLMAAAAEIWRYSLLMRGRTTVLAAGEVRWSDASVLVTGRSANALALATAVIAILLVLKLTRALAQRAAVRPPRTVARQLTLLLVPIWNLFGAGVVLTELDALVRLDPSPTPITPSPIPMRWRTRDLPRVGAPPAATDGRVDRSPPIDAAEPPMDAAERVGATAQPDRLVGWWWACWVVNGALVVTVLVLGRFATGVQARANSVELHAVLDLSAAAVALLTAALASRWRRRLRPQPPAWPAGWVLFRESGRTPATAEPAGSGA